MRKTGWLLLAALVVLVFPSPAHAYIGPGAGFAVAGSFFAVFAAFFSAVVLLFTWPIRLLWRLAFGRRQTSQSSLIILFLVRKDGGGRRHPSAWRFQMGAAGV